MSPQPIGVALVTGGGTGLGRAISLALARRGTSVAVNFSHSAAEATETVERIQEEGGHAQSMRADVSRSEDVDRLISSVLDKFGRLDLLVNAAGVTVRIDFSNLDGIDERDWDRILAVNVKGVWLASRAAARVMNKQGAGVIVNVASTSAIVPVGSSLPYAVSKAAVAHLTKCLAVALAPTIRVNAVAPGFMPTRWNAQVKADEEQRYRDRALLGRTVSVEDVASSVLALADNPSVTGQVLAVDAGFTAR